MTLFFTTLGKLLLIALGGITLAATLAVPLWLAADLLERPWGAIVAVAYGVFWWCVFMAGCIAAASE